MTGPTAGEQPARRPSADELLGRALAYAETAAAAEPGITGSRPAPERITLVAAARLAEMFGALARVTLDFEQRDTVRAVGFEQHVGDALTVADPGVAELLYGAGAPGPCATHGEHPHDGATCLDCPICRPPGRAGHDEKCESQYVMGRYSACRCHERARPAPAGQRAGALAPHACATCTAAYRDGGEVGVCVTCAHQCGSPACRGEPAPVGSALAHFLTFGAWPDGTRRLRPVPDGD